MHRLLILQVRKFIRKEHYTKQKFIVEQKFYITVEDYFYNSEQILIQDFRQERNLFDNEHFYRKVNLSYLDEKIDSLNDFEKFVNLCKNFDILFLEDDRPKNNNLVYKNFENFILKGYIYFFEKYGIKVKILSS